jgi:type I restriction enzyme S subunit
MSARTDNRKESWTETTLGQLNGERGQTIEPAKTPDKQFELYSVPIYPTAKPEVVKGREIGSNKQMVEPRSVLLCKINPHINRVWVVGDFTTYTKIASTEWIVFPLTEEIHPEFLCYFLQQYAVRDFLAHNASGVGGSLMRVKPSTIRDYPFAYPRLLSQRGIVAEIEKRFTRLDAGVAALRRVQANLKRYRAAVLKAACEGRLLSTTGSVSFQPLMDNQIRMNGQSSRRQQFNR